MTHDKLCELTAGCVCAKWLPEGTECDNCMCDCALIAKVRDDESQIALKRLALTEYAKGYRNAIGDAVQAIEELQEDSPYVRADEVIEALSDITDLRGYLGKSDVLAAIDALRGSGNPDTPPSAEKGEKP